MSAVFTRARLGMLGWNLLVLGVILVLFSAVVFIGIASSLLSEVDRNLAQRGEEMATYLRTFGGEGLALGPDGYRGGLFYLLATPDGHILANPQGVTVSDLQMPTPLGPNARFATAVLDGSPVRLYVRPLSDTRFRPAVLVVGQSLLPEAGSLRQLLVMVLIAGATGLLLSVAGAWFLAGRSLIPVQRAFARQQEFTADAAHELRTPLTVLRAATDVLDKHRTEPLADNGELFDDVRHEIGRMERLVADLLTLARSDLGELNLAVGHVALGALASEVTRRLAPLATGRTVTLTCATLAPDPMVEADPDRLQQVLVILLDNALKHTPSGGRVAVSVARQGAEAAMAVTDTGEGIPPEHLNRLFDRFYQVDKARSRSGGGAGLGLAIAKSLVEAHGGRLTIASTVGKGTTVSVRLPLHGRAPSFASRLGRAATRVVRPAGPLS